MTKSSAVLQLAFDARRGNIAPAIAIVIGLSVVLGLLLTDSTDEMIAYLLIAFACGAPIVLWVLGGATSIPLMAGFSAVCFIYYAMPILKGHLSEVGFTPSEVLSGGATVALFLVVASIVWWLLLVGGARRSFAVAPQTLSGSLLERFVFLGLIFGLLYYIILFMGAEEWLGPLKGLVRAPLISTSTLAFFLAGHARALGSLRGQKWVLAIAGMGITVIFSLSSLFLVEGMTFCVAAVFGYTMTAKRLPWIFLFIVGVTVTVLHAGKDDMRDKYWASRNGFVSEVPAIPNLMAEWVGDGLEKVTSSDNYRSVLDRASLMQLFLRSKRLAPDYVPFLEGKTYAVLPEMLVPRFLYPDKITSQEAMNMLNVHFGFETAKDTQKTAVGWGLIAEAYANFAYLGVVGVALVLGLLTGLVERWSNGAPLTSLPAVVAVTVLIRIIDMEADAASLLTALFQSVLGVLLIFWLLGTLSKQRNGLAQRQQIGANGSVQPQ